MPHFCTLSRLRHCNQIIVNVITTTVHDYIDNTKPTSLAARPKKAVVLQLLYNYIVTHLDASLPTIKELAKMFSSNTFTLKDGFSYYFITSIHHFCHKSIVEHYANRELYILFGNYNPVETPCLASLFRRKSIPSFAI